MKIDPHPIFFQFDNSKKVQMSLTKEGWLTKQGGMIKSWKKRWFMIDGSLVRYFKKERSEEKGSFNLAAAVEISAASPKECKKQPSLKVVIPHKRTYYIQAQSESDRQQWIEVFQRVQKYYQGQLKTSPAQNPQTQPQQQPQQPQQPQQQAQTSQMQPLQQNTQTAPRISVDDFKIIKVLGKGSYGKVQLVQFNRDGKYYALKSMHKQLLSEQEQIQQSITERNILIQARHPFLTYAHYTFQTPGKIYMVTDYIPGGELFNRIKVEHKFSEPRVRLYAAEILLGLGYLHSLGLIYRDLKPENILICEDGHLKLTDYGLVKKAKTTSTFCGTPEYMAPEMIQQLPYTKAVDWWSLGIVIYELLTGLPPFYDQNTGKMYRNIIHNELTFPPYVSPEARDIISKLLNKDPKSRLGASDNDVEDIKCQPFFSSLNWNDVLEKKIVPEWKPSLQSSIDTSNFDPEVTGLTPVDSFTDSSVISQEVQNTFNHFTYDENLQNNPL